MKLRKILTCILVMLLLTCGVLASFSFETVAKDMVLIEEKSNCDLIYKAFNNDQWANEGSLTKANNEYVLTSNGWAQWLAADCLSFGYVPVAFNYSDGAQITVETTMTAWNGLEQNAGAGLMIRSGLEPGSSCIMFHFRPGSIMITYRMIDDNTSSRGKTITINTSGLYPVSFKAVVEKGTDKVQCYYKLQGDSDYMSFGAAPFTYSDNLYVGISAYSNTQDHLATAKFSSFSYKVEAPEGYTVGGDTGTEEESKPQEPEIILPEDYPVSEDVLLRETFTDGSMTEGEASVINPIWKTNAEEINIITNEEQTNRYLSEYLTGGTYYYTGSQSWTDYKLLARINFTNEYAPEESNQVYFVVRNTDIAQYGFQCYFVGFKRVGSKMIMGIGVCHEAGSLSGVNGDFVKSVELDYLSDDFVDKWHDIEITAFDNTISVSVDNGTWTTSYTDTSYFCKTEGNIGFKTTGAAVLIDDITVTKINDYLGGDYDNQIGGNWDQPIPEYLERFDELGMPY